MNNENILASDNLFLDVQQQTLEINRGFAVIQR